MIQQRRYGLAEHYESKRGDRSIPAVEDDNAVTRDSSMYVGWKRFGFLRLQEQCPSLRYVTNHSTRRPEGFTSGSVVNQKHRLV
jgi:hypothetical protein